jgi:hypothetical protein
VIYCVIVLVVYYKRASKEYPYWEYLFPRDPWTDNSTESQKVSAMIGYAGNNPADYNSEPGQTQ